jgi:hypothetical protein
MNLPGQKEAVSDCQRLSVSRRLSSTELIKSRDCDGPNIVGMRKQRQVYNFGKKHYLKEDIRKTDMGR